MIINFRLFPSEIQPIVKCTYRPDDKENKQNILKIKEICLTHRTVFDKL